MGKIKAAIQIPGKIIGWIYSKTPAGKAAAKAIEEKAAVQLAREAEIKAIGGAAEDIAVQTTKSSGSTYGKPRGGGIGKTILSIGSASSSGSRCRVSASRDSSSSRR